MPREQRRVSMVNVTGDRSARCGATHARMNVAPTLLGQKYVTIDMPSPKIGPSCECPSQRRQQPMVRHLLRP